MKSKNCRFCNEVIQYETPQQLGGHITSCKKNPKRQEIDRKANENKKVITKIYHLTCKKCGKEYEKNIKITDFNKNKYSKYCSRRCANSRMHSDEVKNKISKSIINYITKKGTFGCLGGDVELKGEKNNCKICGKKVKKHSHVYCSSECKNSDIEYKNKMSEITKKRFEKHPEQHPNRLCAGIKESYPERITREYLEKFGLIKNKDFYQQFPIEKYFVDFYFPVLNLILEIDGSRWHDLNSEKEIKRQNIVEDYAKLIRFDAYNLIKKKYQEQLNKIIQKIIGSN